MAWSFLTPAETALAGRATNINTMQVGYAALNPAEFARTASINPYQRSQSYSGPGLTFFDKPVSLPADQSTLLDIPLNPAGKSLATGLYFYQLQAPGVTFKTQQVLPATMVVVSRIHLALKLSQNQLTAWAVNLESQQPLKGASLGVYTSSKNGDLSQVGTIQTNDTGQGVLTLCLPKELVYPHLCDPGQAGGCFLQPGDDQLDRWGQRLGIWHAVRQPGTVVERLCVHRPPDLPPGPGCEL